VTDPDIWSPTSPAAPGGRATSADGTPIAWFRAGPADGPPLLLIHGAGSDHTTFRVVGPRFAARRAVYAMDRRGRGSSGDGPAYSIEREAEDVTAVIAAIAAREGGPVDVVGHSYGGRLALSAAPLAGEDLRRLVTYESAPAPPGMTFEEPDLVEALAAAEARDDRPAIIRLFMRGVAGMSEADLAAFEASPIWPVRVAIAGTILRELTADRADGDAAAIERLGAAVMQPVLQLLGGSSAPIFALGTASLDGALPDGRVLVLAGQRHNAHHADPDRFVVEVERFLDGG
jgi:pimeloyl-ACP methyl ester carboxylesterase